MNDPFFPQRRLFPTSMMARRLRVTVRWLRDEAEAGRLPCLKAGDRFLFCPKTVEAALLKRARGTTQAKVPIGQHGEGTVPAT